MASHNPTYTCGSSGHYNKRCRFCQLHSTPRKNRGAVVGTYDYTPAMKAYDCPDCKTTIWNRICFPLFKPQSEVSSPNPTTGQVEKKLESMEVAKAATNPNEHDRGFSYPLDPEDPYDPYGVSEGPRDTLRRWDRSCLPVTRIDEDDEELVVVEYRS